MGLLSRDEILKVEDLQTETVEVPEWGGSVMIRTLTGMERDRFESSLFDGKKRNFQNFRARLVALTLVDENGNRLFNEADIPALGKKSAAALNRLFSAAQELNGFTPEDVDELTKNSETGQGADSALD